MVGIGSAKEMRKVLCGLCQVAPDMRYWQTVPIIELSLWGEALMVEGDDA